MGRRAPTKTPLPTYKPISQTVTMHVSQRGLNILIHSFFLFLKTPEYHLDGIEPRIIVFCSEDRQFVVTTVFLGLCEHLFLGFRRFHLYSRWAQTTCGKHRTSISAVSLDGPPIGSSHDPESTSTDRQSAQATVRSPLDGPPIGSSHDPESTSTDRPSAQATDWYALTSSFVPIKAVP